MRSVRLSFARALSAGAWTLAVCTMIIPPTLFASATRPTSTYEVRWPEAEKTLFVEVSESGYVVTDADRSFEEFISQAPGHEMQVEITDDDPAHTMAFVTMPDGMGGERTYTVAGRFDPSGAIFQADIYGENFKLLAKGVEITTPTDEEMSPNVIIVVIVGVGAAGFIACGIVALATNCVDDCANGCALEGASMLSANEGLCGVCSCRCASNNGGGGGKAPLPDPSGVCPEGFHECCNNQCCSDEDPPLNCT